MEWHDRVDRLLYDGEHVEDRLEIGEATVVVTSHRVLVFTPEGDGADFRQADRPNVRGATVAAEGTPEHLLRAGTAGLVGAVLLGTAVAVDFGTVMPTIDTAGAADAPGAGSIVGTIDLVARLFVLLDVLVLLGGLGATALALAFVGLYLRSRTRNLALEVAGDDDLAIPVPGPVPGVTDDLEAAIEPEPIAAGGDGAAGTDGSEGLE